MSQTPSLPPSIFDAIPWNNEDQAIWIASSMILKRNLAQHHFPAKLEGSETDQVLQNLKNTLLELSSLEHPQFFLEKELSSNDRELLLEHFLIMRGGQDAPSNGGIVVDDKGEFLAQINGENHLELRGLTLTNQWETTWNQLSQIENQISEKSPFAFSPKFGYLTSDPADCGTGLTARAFLHLPALIHSKQIESALANTDEEEISYSGIAGSLEDPVGDLLVIHNNFSIGMNEEAILHAIQIASTKLIGAEKTMRAHLKEEENTEIKDLVSKGYGLLIHSYQLDAKEALNLISLMKLGLCLNYITGIEDSKLSELFFKCRRGHLCHLFPELTQPKEIAHKRAEFLHQELKGIELSSKLQ